MASALSASTVQEFARQAAEQAKFQAKVMGTSAVTDAIDARANEMLDDGEDFAPVERAQQAIGLGGERC